MSQELKSKIEFLNFPPPTKLSVWDKWLEQRLFNSYHLHFNGRSEYNLRNRLISKYYGDRSELWSEYRKELATSGIRKI